MLKRYLWMLFLVIGANAIASSRSVPANVESVLSQGTAEFKYALPGRTYKIQKVWDPVSKSIVVRTNSRDIPDADALEKIRQEDLRLEGLKYGTLLGSLKKKFDGLKEEDMVKVVVNLKYPDGIKHPSKFEASEEQLEQHSKQLLDLKPVVDLRDLFSGYGMGDPIHLSDNVGIATVKKYQLRKLMFDKNIIGIHEYTEKYPALKSLSIMPIMPPLMIGQTSSFQLYMLAQSAYNHSATYPPSTAGTGVKSATFEIGLEGSFLNCIGVNPVYWDPFYNTHPPVAIDSSDSLHSLSTFWCMALAAPGASKYHRNSLDFGQPADVAFIVNNHIQTASLSYSNLTDPTINEFRQMDDFAYRQPYTVFCNPTANAGTGEIADWGCYNALSVGNVQHLNMNHFQIPYCTMACTQTRNPDARYPGTPCLTRNDYVGCAGDREMPNVVTPGYTITTQNCTWNGGPSNCLRFRGGFPYYLFCGTSWSAPITNGIAADVIAANSRMVNYPEKVRAAIMLEAQNVEGGEWDQNVDGSDGAGVIKGVDAVNFAKTYTASSNGGAAVTKGMGYGSISNGTWGQSINYNIKIPSTVPSGKNLKIVLTWDSNPSLTSSVNDLSDLDISCTANGVTYYSQSWESNTEILTIPSSGVTANATYYVNIAQQTKRIPTSATTDFFYYAIAWDWVSPHAP